MVGGILEIVCKMFYMCRHTLVEDKVDGFCQTLIDIPGTHRILRRNVVMEKLLV